MVHKTRTMDCTKDLGFKLHKFFRSLWFWVLGFFYGLVSFGLKGSSVRTSGLKCGLGFRALPKVQHIIFIQGSAFADS